MLKFFWLIFLTFFLLTPPAFAQPQTGINAAPDQRFGTMSLDTLAFSPDGSQIVTGGRDKLVRLWNAVSGANTLALEGHTDWVTDVDFSPDGQWVISGSQDNSVRIWDTHTYAQLFTLTHHQRAVTDVDFSPDGRLIASASLDGQIWLGNAQTGETIAVLPNYGGPVWGIAFSHDGQTLLSGSEDGVIWKWGLYTSSIQALRGHTGPVTSLAFSADDAFVASASWDGTVRLWDNDGELLNTWNDHQNPVMTVQFNDQPDLFQMISAGLDGLIQLRTTDGQIIASLSGNPAPLGAIALSHNGDSLAAASIDGGLEIWDMAQRMTILETANESNSIAALPVITPRPQPTVRPVEVQQLAAPTQIASSETVVSNAGGGINLSLPTANIFSPIKTFPLDGKSWAIDAWEPIVGHLQGTAWVGNTGNIVLGGHSKYPNGQSGIFAGLYGVKIGDPIFLGERRYVVSQILTVNYRDLGVIYPTATDRLTLITCDIPSFDADTNFYIDRLVVIALPG